MQPTPIEPNTTPVIDIPNYTPNFANTISIPKKEDAIIIEAHETINLQDYASAVTQLTSKEAVKFITKMSRGRIKIFLPSAKHAETFIETNPTIKINNILLKTRLYINPNKRIFISGACPTIPNDYILKCIESMGFNCTSAPQHMKAFNNEELSHILLEKRVATIKPSETPIPPKIIIRYDNMEHLIFLEEENNNCRICKKSGHTASRCPNSTHNQSANIRIEAIRNTTIQENMEEELTTNTSQMQNITCQQSENQLKQQEDKTPIPSPLFKEPTDNEPSKEAPKNYAVICYEDDENTIKNTEEISNSIPITSQNTPILNSNVANDNNDKWTPVTQRTTRNMKNLTISTENLKAPKEKLVSPKRKMEDKTIKQNKPPKIIKKKE